MSPVAAALLCDVAGIKGDEARQWVVLAELENPKNAKHAALIRRVLFGLAAMGVALPLMAPNDAQATADGVNGQVNKTPISTVSIRIRDFLRRWIGQSWRAVRPLEGHALRPA